MRISDWSSDVCSSDLLFATLANHALAAWAGAAVAGLLDGQLFRIGVALGFLAMAAWTLVPDKLDDEIGRASGRERVCQDVSFSGGAGTFKQSTHFVRHNENVYLVLYKIMTITS